MGLQTGKAASQDKVGARQIPMLCQGLKELFQLFPQGQDLLHLHPSLEQRLPTSWGDPTAFMQKSPGSLLAAHCWASLPIPGSRAHPSICHLLSELRQICPPSEGRAKGQERKQGTGAWKNPRGKTLSPVANAS